MHDSTFAELKPGGDVERAEFLTAFKYFKRDVQSVVWVSDIAHTDRLDASAVLSDPTENPHTDSCSI